MDMSEYQTKARRTLGGFTDFRDAASLCIVGLTGELGEVSEPLKKNMWHGKPLDMDELKAEIGDVLWYLAGLCTVLDLDLDSVAQANVEKLEARRPGAARPLYRE